LKASVWSTFDGNGLEQPRRFCHKNCVESGVERHDVECMEAC